MKPVETLLLEDDPVTARVLEAVLVSHGHEVRIAPDLASARAAMAQRWPELLLSDINLPDGESFGLLQEIRENKAFPFIPTILISTRAQMSDVLSGLEHAEDYLRKPIEPDELMARVRAVLRLKLLHTEVQELNNTLFDRIEERTRELAEANAQLEKEVIERRAREEDLRKLTAHLHQLQDQERTRFAQEIHDAMGTSLLTLKLFVQGCFAELDPDRKLEQRKRQVLSLLDSITEEARSIAHSLAPLALSSLGLPAALEQLAASLSTKKRSTQVEIRGEFADYPFDWQQNVYRLAQEGLLNAVKHSSSPAIIFRLMDEGERIRIAFRDFGVGFDTRVRRAGIGLQLMRERARQMNGTMTLTSSPDFGTEIVIECEKPQARRRAEGLSLSGNSC